MKLWAVVFWAVVAVWALPFSAAWSQEDMKTVPNDDFSEAQRPAAVFPHDAHNEKAQIGDCSRCHHVYKDGKLVADESSEGQPCAECHGLKDAGRQPGLRKAFHLNCQGCHLEQGKGPVMCGACHVRQ